jgi:hypothetical protein
VPQARPAAAILPPQADVDTRESVADRTTGGHLPRGDNPQGRRSPEDAPLPGCTTPLGPLLDLYEGITRPGEFLDPRLGRGCQRWPEGQWLLNELTGELRPGRCKATNLCPYCRTLYVIETVEMLCLDAAEYAPTLWLVLTAREHLTRAQLSTNLTRIRPTLKRRWPDIEWFTQVEFQRRGALHANVLVKGVPVWERLELERTAIERWCHRVDAEPVGQWSGEITAAETLYRYLQKTLSHGLKAEQAPPLGWKGHRTSQTRGYLVRPASEMRQEARAALAIKRAAWAGLDLQEELSDAGTWRVFHQDLRAAS